MLAITGQLSNLLVQRNTVAQRALLTEREAQLNGIPEWMRELHDEHSEKQAEIAEIEGDLEEAPVGNDDEILRLLETSHPRFYQCPEELPGLAFKARVTRARLRATGRGTDPARSR